jgi:hypothetical protein
MTKILLEILAFMLLFAATEIGRPKEYSIKIFSWKWFAQVTIFVIAAMIFEFLGKYYVK